MLSLGFPNDCPWVPCWFCLDSLVNVLGFPGDCPWTPCLLYVDSCWLALDSLMFILEFLGGSSLDSLLLILIFANDYHCIIRLHPWVPWWLFLDSLMCILGFPGHSRWIPNWWSLIFLMVILGFPADYSWVACRPPMDSTMILIGSPRIILGFPCDYPWIPCWSPWYSLDSLVIILGLPDGHPDASWITFHHCAWLVFLLTISRFPIRWLNVYIVMIMIAFPCDHTLEITTGYPWGPWWLCLHSLMG